VADRGRVVHFVTHPEVAVDPSVPVPQWGLSEHGRARMTALSLRVAAIWSSTERKAMEAATILGASLGVSPRALEALGENHRPSFLPPEVFEATADRFFASPDVSVDGWETARDAQARIVAAVDEVLAESPDGDVAIVAHGGVGTLLLCALRGVEITRALDQPSQGHRFAFSRGSWRVIHGWVALPRPTPAG
jgi:broad specificity phosphatase PhoE